MSLFGEKCERCGSQRTRRSFEGIPTCEKCEAELTTKRQAAKEFRHTCPVDGDLMQKEIVLNLVIDRCPSCDGVWLDGGELELLKRALHAGMRDDFARAMTFSLRL